MAFQPKAQSEIQDAFTWYEAQRTGLGAEFLRSIATARDQLARDPDRYPVTRNPFRRVKLRRFPYSLHFDFDADNVRVHACVHFRQSPARWPGA
ncbi:MAG: type II toxin-antitoxin system RelE/ParE family toxin [Proteobacteria bacterium]|nr:type II toxin-antitoxin system RelE/ParE family toxin [Pseudomonadota bacterium]